MKTFVAQMLLYTCSAGGTHVFLSVCNVVFFTEGILQNTCGRLYPCSVVTSGNLLQVIRSFCVKIDSADVPWGIHNLMHSHPKRIVHYAIEENNY